MIDFQEITHMIELKTQIVIDANIEKVWSTLITFENYPKWNPFIKKASGNLIIGESLTVEIMPPEGKKMKFTPTIVTLKESQELRWVGVMLSKYLFRGEHYFILEPINDHQTKFIHGEIFSGLLVPLMKNLLKGQTYQGFVKMNEALKKEAGIL